MTTSYFDNVTWGPLAPYEPVSLVPSRLLVTAAEELLGLVPALMDADIPDEMLVAVPLGLLRRLLDEMETEA